MPELLVRLLGNALQRVASGRAPDFVIGGHDKPYMRRWWIIPRNQVLNVYLHEIRRSDDDRALHDHPWLNCSVILEGTYVEHTIAAGGIHRRVWRRAGDVVFRRAKSAHRIEVTAPCWSLFLTGPVIRVWGFHCKNGWVDWREFTNPADGGATIGRGCP